jgi:hypothetical protein
MHRSVAAMECVVLLFAGFIEGKRHARIWPCLFAGCSDLSCDVCESDICTDCKAGFILDVPGVCVDVCPAGEYGVVDEVLQCTGQSIVSVV